ncbi:MAG: DEAD/DEAH box helicase [Bacteroidota bacterium]
MSDSTKYSVLEQLHPELLLGVGAVIQKAKVALRFDGIHLVSEELNLLNKAKELCELSIIDSWEEQESDGFKALCSIYFDIATLLALPREKQEQVFELIKIITIGYLGESWHLVRQHLKTLNLEPLYSIEDAEWNKRLLYTSFRALVNTIVKDDWNQLREAITYINLLRREQTTFEENHIGKHENPSEKKSVASELIALYHMAKSIEIMSSYLIDGQPNNALEQITYHLGYAGRFADEAGNFSFKLLIQYFEPFAHKLIRNSLWHITRGVNSRVTRFNEFISHREDKPVFEMLYPQRESIIEGGLLNDAYDAVVVNLPTSSGKTLIAEYRILKALNQFADQGGWVSYAVPTRALANQITIQLQKDLGPIGVRVEKLSGGIELDGFEESLLENDAKSAQFDVLVTTYEKLNLLIRQDVGTSDNRPLVLAVFDEAHNLEEETRGIALELLLTTIKKDCRRANFLLMTPDIVNSSEISSWLSADRGIPISLGLHWWQPNERVIGAVMADGSRKKYTIKLKSLFTEKGTFKVDQDIVLKRYDEAPLTRSIIYGSGGVKKKFSALVASSFENQSAIVLAKSPGDTFDIAEDLWNYSSEEYRHDEDIELVIKYVEAELGRDFPLCKYLKKRIGVHSGALPEEIRFLIEDLMSKEKLNTLVATTTIAQGINFPISSVIMASYSYPFKIMPHRDFWNMVGRVGRTGQKNIGFVGITLKNDNELQKVMTYVSSAAASLQSQMVSMVQKALDNPEIRFEQWLFREPKWSSLLQYISHIYRQTKALDSLIANLEIDLQSTFGYRQLTETQKNYLRRNIREYVKNVAPGHPTLSDQTGFSTVSVRNLIGELRSAGISAGDWSKNQLFSNQNQSLQKLVGMMLNTPEIREQMKKIKSGDNTLDRSSISRLISDWVNGEDIESISKRYFPNENRTKSIESCTRILYSNISNAATWGLAAIQKIPGNGLDWDSLSETEKKKLANLPAMIHYGVNSDEAVLMRKNSIPRSIAFRMGELFRASVGENLFNQSSNAIKTWLKDLGRDGWDRATPDNVRMSGQDYKKVWHKLSGMDS